MKGSLKLRFFAIIICLLFLISNMNLNLFHADIAYIPETQKVYITNYTIGNINSIPSDYVPAKSIEAKGYTAYITTESSGQRFFGESSGYDASFKALVDGGKPYSESILSKTVFGTTTNKECTVLENQYFTKNHVIKLESVAKACGHLDQIQTLWVYVYKDGTKIDSYKQQCAPVKVGTHHVDIVNFFYKIPESGNYTIKVQGKCMGCPSGHANGLSVLPKIYVEEPFIINYNANGGTGAPSSTTIYGAGDISSTIPTRSGYIFRGWGKSSSWCTSRLAYTSSSGGGSANDGTSATISSSKTADEWRSYFGTSGNSGTLYAQWEPITYYLTWHPNGGLVDGNTYSSGISTTVKYGSSIVNHGGVNYTRIPDWAKNGRTYKSGYNFKGWYDAQSGGNQVFDASGNYKTNGSYWNSNGNWNKTNDVTLYAQWEVAPTYTHTLNYNANGGSGAPSSQSVTNTSSTYGMTVSSTVPTRTGYTFAGWNTNSSGTGTNYAAGSSVSVGANASVTLYAQWTPNTNTPYKVNHYLMNTDGSTYALKETESLTGTTATTLTLSNLKNTYEGFTYQGGKGTTAASATKPSSFDTTTTILADGTRVINLYYSRNQYTVTYIDVVDSQTGTQLGKSTSTAYYGTSVSGATKGTDTADSAYYKGYYYSSCTTATVGTSGATVYRIFKLRTIDVNGSVNWNDKSNAYDSRPNDGDVTIYLYRNGELLKSTSTGLVENDNNTFSFTGLQKYNTATGEAYTYTVSQSEVTSQKTPEDKYTTTVDSTGFNFTNTLGNADFHVEGSITWVDYENKYGTRPSEVTLNLYQNNKLFKTQVVDKNATGYSFVNLDKYDDDLNPYTYKVEEVFTARILTWNSTTKKYEEIDAYKIIVDGFDFTNTLVDTKEKPVIPVKPDHINTLTIKLDFNDNINWIDIEKNHRK